MALLFLWTDLSSLANILFAIVKHPRFSTGRTGQF